MTLATKTKKSVLSETTRMLVLLELVQRVACMEESLVVPLLVATLLDLGYLALPKVPVNEPAAMLLDFGPLATPKVLAGVAATMKAYL